MSTTLTKAKARAAAKELAAELVAHERSKWHADPRSWAALDVAERYARREATIMELREALAAADAAREEARFAWYALRGSEGCTGAPAFYAELDIARAAWEEARDAWYAAKATLLAFKPQS